MPDGRGLRWELAVVLLVPIAVAGLLMLAKEQQIKQKILPLDGRGNQTVARGNAAEIAAQATLMRLHQQSDRQLTLLQWAMLSQ